MGEVNVGSQFGDKYITKDNKVALFYRFCYDDSIDFLLLCYIRRRFLL